MSQATHAMPERAQERLAANTSHRRRYLLAGDEQTGDPEQLEAVRSHRGREEEPVQSVHRQAQRLEREAELAVDWQQPAEQLAAGFRRHLPGGRGEACCSEGPSKSVGAARERLNKNHKTRGSAGLAGTRRPERRGSRPVLPTAHWAHYPV